MLGYKERHGLPFLADYLDVHYLYTDLKDEINTIDTFIMLELEREMLRQSQDAYADVLLKLLKKVGIHKHAEPVEKLKKLSILVGQSVRENSYRKSMGLPLQSLEEMYAA